MSKQFYLPEASGPAVIFTVVGNPWMLLLFWVLIISAAAFCVFGVDKRRAQKKNARRIPERTLFLLAALGGSPGALLGMRVFHHKTLHNSFRFGIPAILIVQIALLLLLYFQLT